jgi:hypothetical protein
MSKSQAETTRVIRISVQNFERLGKLKRALQKKTGAKKMTYDQLLAEALNVADVLVESKEVFYWEGNLYADVSEVWSQAVDKHLQDRLPIVEPRLLIDLGKDNTFKVPESES